MSLRLFKPELLTGRGRPPYVTVRADGRFTFNAEASRALEAADLRRVRLFGDRRTKRVVIRPATGDGPETHLISYLRPTPTQLRATLEAKPFLCWLGYSLEIVRPSPVSELVSAQPSSRVLTVHRYELHPLPRRSFEFTLAEPMAPPHDLETKS